MFSIQSTDHSSITAERVLSRPSSGTARMQSRSSPEITPEPPADTMLSASAAGDGSAPGVPRAHKTETGEPVRTPPDPPRQLAVLLLSMINQAGPSGSSETSKRTLDIMA